MPRGTESTRCALASAKEPPARLSSAAKEPRPDADETSARIRFLRQDNNQRKPAEREPQSARHRPRATWTIRNAAEPGLSSTALSLHESSNQPQIRGASYFFLTTCSVCEEQRNTGRVQTRANRRSSPADNMKHFPARIGQNDSLICPVVHFGAPISIVPALRNTMGLTLSSDGAANRARRSRRAARRVLKMEFARYAANRDE